jgi:hypothetical protein
MTTKLTLTIEKSVIKKAKSYAHKTGRSLSKIIQSYLENITKPEPDVSELPDKLNKLIGSVHIPKNLDHKKEIRKIFQSKYK